MCRPILLFLLPALLLLLKQVSSSDILDFETVTDVEEHLKIDLDLKTLGVWLSLKTDQGLQDALQVYSKGGSSKPYAYLTLYTRLSSDVAKGTAITGTTAGGEAVEGIAFTSAKAGDTPLLVQYPNESTCRVGANSNPDTSGCLAPSGTVQLASGESYSYAYNVQTDNGFGHTLEKFSAEMDAFNFPVPSFYEYYGTYDYANQFITTAFSGTETKLSNFNNDFNKLGLEGRGEAIITASVTMNIWMQVLNELRDGIQKCQSFCPNPPCSSNVLHEVDEAVAYFTGSLVQTPADASKGYLLYTRINEECANFGTCTAPNGGINNQIFQEFAACQKSLQQGNCAAASQNVQKIQALMTIPLVQGVLRTSYALDIQQDSSETTQAQATAFAASLLPMLWKCNTGSATMVANDLQVGNAPKCSYSVIRDQLERNYDCLSITCDDVGGLVDPSVTGSYLEGAAPCDKQPSTTSTTTTQQASAYDILGFKAVTDVQEHLKMDLDMRTLGSVLTDQGLQDALEVYSKGASSQPYAYLTLDNRLSSDVAKGTPISGTTTGGATMDGIAFTSAKAGDTPLLVKYPSESTCRVGANSNPDTTECLAPSGTVQVSNGASYTYTYNVQTDNGFGHTLQKFSAEIGPFKLPVPSFYEYYGAYDYANQFVTAAVSGTETKLANFNNDFNKLGLQGRAEAVRVASLTMNIWMRVLDELRDGIEKCQTRCPNPPCSLDTLHEVDEAVAYYTGSLVETPADASKGYLLYTLANDECDKFGTCTSPNGGVNHQIFQEFAACQKSLQQGNCAAASQNAHRIKALMTIPLVQGILRTAYAMDIQRDKKETTQGQAAAFAASLLPMLWKCNVGSAIMVANDLQAGNALQCSYGVIRNQLERNYDCLSITCKDVGGLVAESGSYLNDAAPCNFQPSFSSSSDSSSSTITTSSGTTSNTFSPSATKHNTTDGAMVGLIMGLTVVLAVILTVVAFPLTKRKNHKEFDTAADIDPVAGSVEIPTLNRNDLSA